MPTSASGSPSVHSSQSTTAATSPAGVEDHVVEAVVAVDDRRRPLLGDPRREAAVDVVDQLQLARLRLLPLAVPALELARDVVLLLSQLAESDRVGLAPRGSPPACRPPARRSRAAAPRRRARPLHECGGSGPRRSPSRRTGRRSRIRRHTGRRSAGPGRRSPAARRSHDARGPCRVPRRGARRAAGAGAPRRGRPRREPSRSCSSALRRCARSSAAARRRRRSARTSARRRRGRSPPGHPTRRWR